MCVCGWVCQGDDSFRSQKENRVIAVHKKGRSLVCTPKCFCNELHELILYNRQIYEVMIILYYVIHYVIHGSLYTMELTFLCTSAYYTET